MGRVQGGRVQEEGGPGGGTGGVQGAGSRGGSPGGVQGGVQGGADVANYFFFEFFAFQNRAQGSVGVCRGDNFPPTPPGTRRRGTTRSKFPKFLG